MPGTNIKIGANATEFQQQMKEVTRQLKLVSSECGVASQKAKLFGTAQDQLAVKQKELTAKIKAQTEMLKLHQDRILNINATIDKQKEKQSELAKKIEEVEAKHKESIKATGRSSEETKKLGDELQDLKEKYAKNERAIESSNNELVNAVTKMNNTEKAMLQNKKALQDLNEEIENAKIDKLAEKFEDAGEKATNIGSKMSIVSAGIVGAGTALGKMAFDTEQDLSTLGGRLGLTADEAENLKTIAKNLYNDGFGESLEECVNDVVLLHQNIKETANMTEEQKGKLLEQISTVKTLFGVESEEITKTLNNMMNNGMVDSLEEGLDVITAGFQQGLNSGGDLLDVLYEYSPQFKKLGLDGEAALGYIKAGLDAGGFNADKMADALKELSIRAIDGSKTTSEGFKLIGLDANKMAKEFAAGGESAKLALNKTIEGLKNIKDPLKQDLAGVNLFGTMWEDSSKDAILAMADVGTGLGDITGATQKAGEEANNSIGKQFASVLREAKEACLPLGQEILNLAKVGLPILKEILEKVVGFLNGMGDGGRKVILAIAGIVAIIGPSLVALGSFSKGISNIINGYKDVKQFGGTAIETIKNFGTNSLNAAKTVGNFATTIGKNLVSGITNGIKAIGNFTVSIAKGLVNAIFSGIKAVGNFALSIGKSLVSGIAAGAKAVGNFALTIAKNLVSATIEGAKAVGNLALNLGKATLEFAKSAVQAGISATKFIAHKVATIASTLATTAMSAAQAALNFVMNLNPITLIIIGITALVAAIVVLWNKCEWFRNLCYALFEGLKQAWNATLEFFKSCWDWFIGLWKAAVEGIKSVWNTVCEFFKTIWQGVCTYFQTVWNFWKGVFTTVVNAIKTLWQGICNTMSSIWNGIVNSIKTAWNGFKNLFTTVGNAVRSVWQGICNTVSSIWNGIVNSIKSVWTGFKNIFESVGNTVRSIWSGITGSISSVWNNVVNGVKSAWDGIISPFKRVRDAIGNIWQGVKSLFKLPHFTISGTLNPLKWHDEGVPKIGVQWYWKGGIFNKPTVLNGIGVGDAFNGQGSNAEAVVPLNEMYRKIQEIVKNETRQESPNIIIIKNYMDSEEISSYTYKKIDNKLALAGRSRR